MHTMLEKRITLPYIELLSAPSELLAWFSQNFFFGGKYSEVLNLLIDNDLLVEAMWVVRHIDASSSSGEIIMVEAKDVLRKGSIITPYYLESKDKLLVEGHIMARQGIFCRGLLATENGDIWTLGDIVCGGISTDNLYVNKDCICYGEVKAKSSIVVNGNIEASDDIEAGGKILARSIDCETNISSGGSILTAGELRAEYSIFAEEEIYSKGSISASDSIESGVEIASRRNIFCSHGAIYSGGGIYAKGAISSADSITGMSDVMANNQIEAYEIQAEGVIYPDQAETEENNQEDFCDEKNMRVKLAKKLSQVFLRRKS